MSKYSDDLEKQYPSIKKIKDATRSLIQNGKNLALEEWHDANSLERLKQKIKKGG